MIAARPIHEVQDADGCAVFDRWTGQTVVIAGALQAGLLPVDAAELVTLLNRRAEQG
jgi:hypothetical protein